MDTKEGTSLSQILPSEGMRLHFPVKLHMLLSKAKQNGVSNIISWHPSGNEFVIHDLTKFVSNILPKTFKQSKMSSFRRQLNAYGFQRVAPKGDIDCKSSAMVFFHKEFRRDDPVGAKKITRRRAETGGNSPPHYNLVTSEDQMPSNNSSRIGQSRKRIRADNFNEVQALSNFEQQRLHNVSTLPFNYDGHAMSFHNSGNSSVFSITNGTASPLRDRRASDGDLQVNTSFLPGTMPIHKSPPNLNVGDSILDEMVEDFFGGERRLDDFGHASMNAVWDPMKESLNSNGELCAQSSSSSYDSAPF